MWLKTHKSDWLGIVGTVVFRVLSSVGSILENIVLGNLLFESCNNFSARLFVDVRLSGKDPDVLLAEERPETNARVNHCVVVVISSNHFVIASWGEWDELNFKVSFVFAGINDKCVTFATAPLLRIRVVFVV